MASTRAGSTAVIFMTLFVICCCNDSRTQSSAAERQMASTVHVVLTPLLTKDGFAMFYGLEARDKATGTLLARAEQAKMEGQTLIVDETQYSADGAVVYKGKLFFDASNDLAKEERVEGKKNWDIFRDWPLDTHNLERIEEDAAAHP